MTEKELTKEDLNPNLNDEQFALEVDSYAPIQIEFKNVKIEDERSLLDYLAGGLDIQMSVAVDFPYDQELSLPMADAIDKCMTTL